MTPDDIRYQHLDTAFAQIRALRGDTETHQALAVLYRMVCDPKRSREVRAALQEAITEINAMPTFTLRDRFDMESV